MPTVLMVAEKPSICNSIAEVLSSNSSQFEKKGSIPVHRFSGTFLGRSAKIIVTSVTGHVFSTDFGPEHQSWDVPPVRLFRAKVKKKIESKGVAHTLSNLASGVDYLVLWLDCDREGENICFEVISCTAGRMNKQSGGRRQQIFRAKFSAVTRADIERAMRTLGEPNENESLSVDARQELDLKLGVAFSRFQTRYFQGKYSDLDASCVSYGPCQTPTLGFCVMRHDEIQNFQPEAFWAIDATFSMVGGSGGGASAAGGSNWSSGGVASGASSGSNINFEWSRGRLFNQAAVALYVQRIRDRPTGNHVLKVKMSTKKKSRPTPLNTVELLKVASRSLGIGPKQAMHVAERLYLSGLTSYPRTETTKYPQHMDLNALVSEFSKRLGSSCNIGEYAATVLEHGVRRPSGGFDAGDHPPITPCKAVHPGTLSGDEARLYDYISRRFLASVGQDCEYESKEIVIECGVDGSEHFSATGVRVTAEGFTAIMPGARPQEKFLPDIREGTEMVVEQCTMRSGFTRPPGYLAEHELISLMERHGIGTDASMASHISNIQARNYVTLGNGRTLVPTELGIVLVHGYLKIDPDLVLPKVRADIENQCTLIAEGKARIEDVVTHALDIFEKKYLFFKKHIGKMDTLFGSKFERVDDAGKPFSRCGTCGMYMKLIEQRPRRLYCGTCEALLNLPSDGALREYSGGANRCPIDNFGLIVHVIGAGKQSHNKNFLLCPQCYSSAPDERRADYMRYGVGCDGFGCDRCEEGTCEFSMQQRTVSRCVDTSCPGAMVVDELGAQYGTAKGGNSGSAAVGGHWKLQCNQLGCLRIVRLHGVAKMRCSRQDNCQICGARQVVVFFASGHEVDRNHIQQWFDKLRQYEKSADGRDDTAEAKVMDSQKEAMLQLVETKHKLKGCMICHPALNALTSLHSTKAAQNRRGGRGGSRGRGRGRGSRDGKGGRGRGRGRN